MKSFYQVSEFMIMNRPEMAKRKRVMECKGVSKSFYAHKKEVKVLRDVNLKLYQGEILLINGRSGQGKSVLLSLLGGLDHQSSGEILLENQHLIDLHPSMRRKKIGMVFQSFNLIPSWNALENVEAALEGDSMSRDKRREKAVALISKLNIQHRQEHFPSEMSMGEQQRVALARAFINEPSIILADEPTGSVDSETALEIISLLFSYVKEKNSALLITSHGNFPQGIVDRELILKDGEIKNYFL